MSQSYFDDRDDAYEAHVDAKLDEWKERRAGLYDNDFGSDAWCRRNGRSRIPGVLPGSFSYPLDCEVESALRLSGRLT